MTSVPVVAAPDAMPRSWESRTVARLVAGDDEALGELYDQFAPVVYGLALRLTASATTAEDIVQEVFTWLWQHPDGFDPARGSLRSWLGVVTHRRCVDRIRRETSMRRREESDARRTPAAPPDIAEAATSVVVAQRLREAVSALPPEQRSAIELAYFGGRTFREVAQALGIPEGTAKSRLRLGLQKLADALRAQGIVQWS